MSNVRLWAWSRFLSVKRNFFSYCLFGALGFCKTPRDKLERCFILQMPWVMVDKWAERRQWPLCYTHVRCPVRHHCCDCFSAANARHSASNRQLANTNEHTWKHLHKECRVRLMESRYRTKGLNVLLSPTFGFGFCPLQGPQICSINHKTNQICLLSSSFCDTTCES